MGRAFGLLLSASRCQQYSPAMEWLSYQGAPGREGETNHQCSLFTVTHPFDVATDVYPLTSHVQTTRFLETGLRGRGNTGRRSCDVMGRADLD